MRKARIKHKPRTNKLIEVANEPELQQLEIPNQLQKHYCQEVLLNDDTTVIYLHQYSLKLLGRIEEIHVDCSIACKAEIGNDVNLYLITVVAMVKNQDYPIAFGILKLKAIDVFSSFFRHIRDKTPSAFMPNSILTSCDGNLQEALKRVFPDATIKVMWFFYANSVMNYAKDNGMLKLTNKSLFHLSSLKMILAIPLIPANYMAPGLDSLKKWMSEKSVNFEGLCNYIDSNWLKGGAEKISIFNGLSHSINNYVQNFNRVLLHNLDVENLTKKQLLEAISKQATKTIKKLSTLKNPQSLKKAQKLQKTILETATHNWIKANIHLRRPIQFLQQVSHCIDDSMLNFLLHYDVEDKKTKDFHVSETNLQICNYLNTCLNTTSSPSLIMTEPPPLVFFKKAATVVRPIPLSTEPSACIYH